MESIKFVYMQYAYTVYSISFYIKVAQIPKSGSLWPCQKSMPEGSCAIYVHPGVNQCWSKLKSINRRAMMSSWTAESHEQLHQGSHGQLILLDKNGQKPCPLNISALYYEV